MNIKIFGNLLKDFASSLIPFKLTNLHPISLLKMNDVWQASVSYALTFTQKKDNSKDIK